MKGVTQNWSRNKGDHAVGRSSLNAAFRIAAVVLASAGISLAAQPNDGNWHGTSGPVYQRRAFESKLGFNDFRHKDRRFFHQPVVPNVQSNWFTRPYPYHLDYYKMRYGGSYAPYFGNLYGPPQVVTAPPYFGPYYGDFGYGAPNGFGGVPGEFPGQPGGVMYQGPVVESAPNSTPSIGQPVQQAVQPNGESLPAPGQ
jgi:hypothetical protein